MPKVFVAGATAALMLGVAGVVLISAAGLGFAGGARLARTSSRPGAGRVRPTIPRG
jgi:hypothetical protein